MQRTTINLILLLVVICFTSACRGNLFVSSTATSTSTTTLTHTPQPTNPFTPTKTPRPTRTPLLPSPTFDLPKGTPLAEWSSIPIMPSAVTGQTGDSSYTYVTKATPEEVLAYYFHILSKYGWEPAGNQPADSRKRIFYPIHNRDDTYSIYLGFHLGAIYIKNSNGLTYVYISYREP